VEGREIQREQNSEELKGGNFLYNGLEEEATITFGRCRCTV